MTVFGSTCTRPLINRTLICNAILYHFHITMICCRFNCPCIPPTLFLLSRPLEQLEFIRSSNFLGEICFVPVSRPIYNQRFMLPRDFQSRYRRHLFDLKPLLQITRARRSLNQLSRLRIHSIQEFEIIRIQSRKHMSETNIVALHDHLPQRRQRRTTALPFHRGISISSPPRQGLFFSLSLIISGQFLFFFTSRSVDIFY